MSNRNRHIRFSSILTGCLLGLSALAPSALAQPAIQIIGNSPPTISNIPDQNIVENSNTGPVPFTVGDIDEGPNNLVLSRNSSDTTLVPLANIVFAGSGANRTVTVTPAPNRTGRAVITVTVSDTGGGRTSLSASDTFTVDVSPNTPPTISDIPDQQITEDGTTGILNFFIGDRETPNQLTLTKASDNQTLVPLANIVLGGSGGQRTVTVTPAGNQFGVAVITITVSDGSASTSDQFRVTVSPVNDQPTLDALNNLTVNEDSGPQNVNLTGISSGAPNESQTLVITAVSDNPNLIPNPTINYISPNTTGVLTFTPAANLSGAARISVTINDGGQVNGTLTRSFTVTVNPVNDPPTLNTIADVTINEDAGPQTVNLAGIGTGAPNEQQTLTVTASSDNPNLIPNPTVTYTSPNATGSLSFTPAANGNGSAIITVTVNDGGTVNPTFSRAFRVTVSPVNDPPTLGRLINLTINEDAGPQTVNLSGISSGAANESQTLVVTASSDNTGLIPNPTVTYTSPNATGSLNFTPVANANGSALITVTVNDGGANGTASVAFTVTVTPVNDAPTLAAIGNVTINEDSGPQTVNLTGIGTGAPDEQQTLTVTATSDNPGTIPNPTVSYTSPNAAGSLSFTPTSNNSGSAIITVTVNDGGNPNPTFTRTFTVTLNAVNDPPTLAPINNVTIAEDAGAQTVNLTGIGSGAPNEQQTLTVTATSNNTGLIPNPTVNYTSPNATGSLSFTPVANGNGSAVITVTVSDGGAVNATQTFTVTVTPVNDPPTLAAISNVTINEDAGTQTVNLTGIGSGAANESQTLTVTATSNNTGLIPNPTVNYTSPNATGSLSFTPVANGSGSAVITVTVSDGGAVNATQTFTVTVTPVNDPPTLAAINNVTINEDAGPQTVNLAGIGSGAPNESQTLTVTATSNNTGLIPNPTVSYTSPNTTGSLSFTPVANGNGSAVITVTVSDGGAVNATQTFTVTVTPVNDPPTLAAISNVTINEDAGPQTVNLTGIGTGAANESQTLTVTATSNNTGLIPNPTVSYTSPNTTGSLSFAPVANSSGSAVITVTVSDGGAVNASQTFTVTVNPVNDPPTITDISDQSINEDGTTGLLPFTIGDVDSPLTQLTVTATSNNSTLVPAGGIVLGGTGANRTVTVTPAANQSGLAVITVTVSDGTANAVDTFVLSVGSGNDPPTISNIPNQNINEDTSTVAIPFTVSDPETAAASLTVTASSDNTTLVPLFNLAFGGSGGNRTVTVTPAANQSGQAQITLTVSDGVLSASSRFTVTVSSINDPPTISNIADTSTSEDTPTSAIAFVIGDVETPLEQLTLTSQSDNTTLVPQSNIVFGGAGANRTVTVTPALNQFGTALITVTVSDGAASATDQFTLRVIAANDPPTISDITDQTITENSVLSSVPFTVGDPDDAASTLLLSASSSNPSLVPVGAIQFGGAGANRTVSITPTSNQSGNSLITITVSDGRGGSASDSFSLTISSVALPPTITVPPESKIVFVGEPVSFQVVATGTAPLQYQWRFNGANITGATQPTYTLEAVQSSNAGNYTVVVSNRVGSAQSSAVLTVRSTDFGDAPDPTYPTLLRNNGAWHAFLADFRLGTLLDIEPDGQPSADALGDDGSTFTADDEDGVRFLTPLNPGALARVEVTASQTGRLDAWLDFNANGSWADTTDQIFASRVVVAGPNVLEFTVPAGAKLGATFARFRFSRQGGLGFVGPATEGEVEDYQIGISAAEQRLDFGDAPDTPYPTTLKNNGARHVITEGLSLGRTIDPEADGQPNADATGDDIVPAGVSDDEEGVNFNSALVPGSSSSVEVTVIGEGFLNAWVDFNGNGSWADTGEQIFVDLPVTPGTKTLPFNVPAAAKGGVTFARFRLSHQRQLSFVGPATDGEVEDHRVTIEAELLDFGDAPETENGGFPTRLARNGARHQIVKGFHLGRLEDGEANGQPNSTATGDDTTPAGAADDEEGVRFLAPLNAGTLAQVEVRTTAGGMLDAWVDFNHNLSWVEPSDRIFNAKALAPGLNVLSFLVPATATEGPAVARFRLSRKGGLPFDGHGGDGEVEDHVAQVERRPACDLACTGRDFWITFPGTYAPDPANPVKPKLCIVGTAGTVANITIPGLTPPFNANALIPAGGMVEVPLPSAADLGNANDEIQNKGIHIVATQPVGVYGVSKVQYSSDGFLALPTESLGTDYYVMSFANGHTGMPELNGSQFAIVAPAADTTVTIIPSVVTGMRDSGFPYTITLAAGETYQLRTTSGEPSDLTGTHILADKPIAVFGSHAGANVQSGNRAFVDYLVEQLPPVNRWAMEFYARRLATRFNGDTFRVLASQSNTVVSVNGLVKATLNPGEFYQTVRPASPLGTATQITATRPVLVAQFANSSDFDLVATSDPFMALVPGRPLFSEHHLFCAPAGFSSHYINVIVPTAAAGTVTFDGLPLGGFNVIGGTAYSERTVKIAAGPHMLMAAQPASVLVYGWDKYESYGFPSCLFFGDTTPPTITCPPPVTVTLGVGNTTGATVCQAPVPDFRAQATATDNCPPRTGGTVGGVGGGQSVSQDPPPGTLLGPGIHEVKISVADGAGNIGTCSTTFTVIDPNPNPNAVPVLHCPSDMTVKCTDPEGAIVNFNAFATIGCLAVPLQCNPPSGSFFPVGTTTVNCVLPQTPSLTCSFKVTVNCAAFGLSLANTELTVSWEGGATLEVADSPTGPWTTVSNAPTTFTISTSSAKQKFYRIK